MPPPGAGRPSCFALSEAFYPDTLRNSHGTSARDVLVPRRLARRPASPPFRFFSDPAASGGAFQPATFVFLKKSLGAFTFFNVFQRVEALSDETFSLGVSGVICACCEPLLPKENRPPRQDVEDRALRQDAELPCGRRELAGSHDIARNTARSRGRAARPGEKFPRKCI